MSHSYWLFISSWLDTPTTHIFLIVATILAFPFMDPVQDLLLTGLDDSFSSRDAVELVWSVQARKSLLNFSMRRMHLCSSYSPFPSRIQ